MRRQILGIIRQLIWSIAAVVIAFGATEVLYHFDPVLRQHGHYAFFLAAIAIAAWRGGFLCAVLTVVFSALVVAWIMPPANSFKISSPEDVVRLTLFSGLGLLISYLHYARHHAERSLQESDRRLRFSLDSSRVACWDANMKTGSFWKSHNLPEIYGREGSNFASTYEGFFAYIHPDDREFFHLASVGSGADHRDYEIAHRIILGDDSSRRVKTRGRMYIGDDGRVERMVGVVYSIENEMGSSGPLRTVQACDADIAAHLV